MDESTRKLVEYLEEIRRVEELKEEQEEKELTIREWDLIYDAVQRRIEMLESFIPHKSERRQKMIEDKIDELEVILNKVAPKTV